MCSVDSRRYLQGDPDGSQVDATMSLSPSGHHTAAAAGKSGQSEKLAIQKSTWRHRDGLRTHTHPGRTHTVHIYPLTTDNAKHRCARKLHPQMVSVLKKEEEKEEETNKQMMRVNNLTHLLSMLSFM